MTAITLIYLFLAYLVLINIVTFILFGVDKERAKQSSKHYHKQRIEEATLLWLAVFGGSVGAILGMHIFHHKTHHKKFTILLPLILVAQLALAAHIYYEVTSVDDATIYEIENKKL